MSFSVRVFGAQGEGYTVLLAGVTGAAGPMLLITYIPNWIAIAAPYTPSSAMRDRRMC